MSTASDSPFAALLFGLPVAALLALVDLWPLAVAVVMLSLALTFVWYLGDRWDVDQDRLAGLRAVNAEWVEAMTTYTPKPAPAISWDGYPDESAPGDNPDPAPAEPTLNRPTEETTSC